MSTEVDLGYGVLPILSSAERGAGAGSKFIRPSSNEWYRNNNWLAPVNEPETTQVASEGKPRCMPAESAEPTL